MSPHRPVRVGDALSVVLKRTLFLGLLLVLSGCARLTTRPPELPTVDEAAAGTASAAYRARRASLEPMREWSFSGRIAFASPEDSGSGRIDWTQDGDAIDIRLSAPVSRQSWRLIVDPSGARLEGLDDGGRHAESADELLAGQFGFDLPMAALANWLRGLAAAGPVDEARIDESGRPLELHQHGWVIRFPDWHSTAPADLPRRVFAERDVPGGQDRVRVVIDHWRDHDNAD
ncbi:MAG: outer membrane lipoprotein LolB [Xanthomonadales bacterium]|nr:outer membrane lipoprotein LolB [Xanthomonadales bacterium]